VVEHPGARPRPQGGPDNGKDYYSPEERKARLESAHAELTSAVQAIATSNDWRAFLEFARKLHTYSAQNECGSFNRP